MHTVTALNLAKSISKYTKTFKRKYKYNSITFDISKRKMVDETLVLTKLKNFDETLNDLKIEEKFCRPFL